MGYIITDGNSYLNAREGNSIVSDVNLATQWEKEKSAKNTLAQLKITTKRNILGNTSQRDKFKVVEYVLNKQETYNGEPIELNFDIQEEVNSLLSKVESLEKRQQYLLSKLSYFDKKIVDIEHCAEFYKLDIQRGYKLYKILHDTLEERREIKNELACIKRVIGSCVTKDGIYEVSDNIDRIYNNRNYTPRVVDELFDLLK